MSVWSEFSGSVIIKADSQCSLRECIQNTFGDELNIRFLTQRYFEKAKLNIDFAITVCTDGVDAATRLKTFIDMIKSYDKTAEIDIKASIRFLA
jgi:hypothetical protein